MKKKVTIHDVNGVKMIAVDNEVFDWGLEENYFITAKNIAKTDPLMKDSFIGNIQKHFVECFSEFVGQKLELKDINKILSDGEI